MTKKYAREFPKKDDPAARDKFLAGGAGPRRHSLSTQFQQESSEERTSFYEELYNITEFREKIPLHFLISKILDKSRNRRQTATAKAVKHDDSSYYNNDSDKKSNFVVSTFSPSEQEILHLVLRKTISYFYRDLLSTLRHSFSTLCSHRDEAIQNEKNSTAVRLQSLYRQYRARLQLHELKKRRLSQLRKRRLKDEARHRHVVKCVIKIQRIVRGRTGRRVFDAVRRRRDASEVIRAAWGRRQVKKEARREMEVYDGRWEGAVRIQCWYRRVRARVLIRYLRWERDVAIVRELCCLDRAVLVRTRFEREGAAFVIQKAVRRHGMVPLSREGIKKCGGSIGGMVVAAGRTHVRPGTATQNRLKKKQESKGGSHFIHITIPPLNTKAVSYGMLFGKNTIEPHHHKEKDQETLPTNIEINDDEKRTNAIISIQQLWRATLARETIWNLSQRSFQKMTFVQDPSYNNNNNGTIYYHNLKTNNTLIKKPTFFHNHDIQHPHLIPYPSHDHNLIKPCDVCCPPDPIITPSKYYNVQDRETLCDACHDLVASKKRSRTKTFVPIPICRHCHSQMASKKCLSCDRSYCDDCFFYWHGRTVMLGQHPFVTLLEHCEVCENYVGLLRLESVLEVRIVCKACFRMEQEQQYYWGSNSGRLYESVEEVDLIPTKALILLEKKL